MNANLQGTTSLPLTALILQGCYSLPNGLRGDEMGLCRFEHPAGESMAC